jgi:hypothetical protein
MLLGITVCLAALVCSPLFHFTMKDFHRRTALLGAIALGIKGLSSLLFSFNLPHLVYIAYDVIQWLEWILFMECLIFSFTYFKRKLNLCTLGFLILVILDAFSCLHINLNLRLSGFFRLLVLCSYVLIMIDLFGRISRINKKKILLYESIRSGEMKRVKFFITPSLFSEGVDDDEKNTSLLLACSEGQIEVVKLLIQNGAAINCRSDGNRNTPLIAAAGSDHKEIVEFLLSKGADKELTNEYGDNYLNFKENFKQREEREEFKRKAEAEEIRERSTNFGKEKTCGACGKIVSVSSMAGQRCPHCGAYWGAEKTIRK